MIVLTTIEVTMPDMLSLRLYEHCVAIAWVAKYCNQGRISDLNTQQIGFEHYWLFVSLVHICSVLVIYVECYKPCYCGMCGTL